MFLVTFLFVLLLTNVKSDTVFVKRFNTNQNPDNSFMNNENPIYGESFTSSSLEENSDLDKIHFHYPSVEFLTTNASLESEYGDIKNSFTSLQTEIPLQEPSKNSKRFPRLKQLIKNVTDLNNPVRLSYIKKISKPESVEYNQYSKYAEMSTGSSEAAKTKTKDTINALLKNYLDKLYSKKYNSTSDQELLTDSQGSAETKLFKTNNVWDTSKKNKIGNIKKLFSLFTIVQFNNTECNATNQAGSYLGLCYTDTECANLGGTSVGNCANSYGVCCVFRGSCGGSAAQNCSYFESPNYPDYYPAGGDVIIPSTIGPPVTTINPSPTPDPRLYWNFLNNDIARQNYDPALSCIFSVYKLNDDIKKMKIDFLDLELAGPTNGTCVMEKLLITGQNTNSIVPPICGYNTGQSIYVDVSQSAGPLKLMILANVSYKKRFKIMICQYSDLCLPDNCLQIYNGITGSISSFNYNQVSMFNRSVPGYFNNLNYAICIQKASGYCSITYTNVNNGIEYPFSLVNFANGVSTVPIGTAGIDLVDCPDDYIVIGGTTLCGYKFNDGSTTSNLFINSVVTDTSSGPIVILVRTNAAAVGYGFRLFFTQNRC